MSSGIAWRHEPSAIAFLSGQNSAVLGAVSMDFTHDYSAFAAVSSLMLNQPYDRLLS